MFDNKKKKVGIISEDLNPYYESLASVRLRVYDVINFMQKTAYSVELFNENEQYDIVIFMKVYTEKYAMLARELKKRRTIIVFDINTIIIENVSELVSQGVYSKDQSIKVNEQNKGINEFLSIADHIIVTSSYLEIIYSRLHPSVFQINESISDDFFEIKKEHKQKDITTLVYSGYSNKAYELNSLKDIFNELEKKHKFEILLITDKDPKLNLNNIRMIQYNQRDLPKILLEGDIKLAPRDLNLNYNLGHSFTKVAYPMSVGIPALASPVPSYINTEVVINETDEDWYRNLDKYISNVQLRSIKGESSRNYVQINFGVSAVRKAYISFFEYILNND